MPGTQMWGLSELYGALIDAMIEGLKSLLSILATTDGENPKQPPACLRLRNERDAVMV